MQELMGTEFLQVDIPHHSLYICKRQLGVLFHWKPNNPLGWACRFGLENLDSTMNGYLSPAHF